MHFCFIGLHIWEYSEDDRYRACGRCGKVQMYGDFELSWIDQEVIAPIKEEFKLWTIGTGPK